MADVNRLLRYLREDMAILREASASIPVPVSAIAAMNTFHQLDALLSSGGAPPEDWQHSSEPPMRGVVENVTDDIKVLRHENTNTVLIAFADPLSTHTEDRWKKATRVILSDEDARKLGEELTR